MKVKSILLLCSAAALPQLAMADAKLNAEPLGRVRAILDSCTKVDPKDIATFKKQWDSTVVGASATQLASVEGGSDYKRGYDYAVGLLSKLAPRDLARGCAGGAAEFRGEPPAASGDDSGKSHDGKSHEVRRTSGRIERREVEHRK